MKQRVLTLTYGQVIAWGGRVLSEKKNARAEVAKFIQNLRHEQMRLEIAGRKTQKEASNV